MKIAYLTNQYPKVSHSFIRREIHGLEKLGFDVTRISVRPSDDTIVDQDDINEVNKTLCIISEGFYKITVAFLKTLISKPITLLSNLFYAFKLGLSGERGPLIHIIYLFEATLLYQRTKKLQIKHIHCHFGTNPTTVAMLCKRIGGPDYSFTSHGPEEYDKGNSIHLSEKIIQAKFVIAITNFGRSQLYRYSEYKHWGKIHIIHCAVGEKFLSSEVIDIPTDNKLVCVGRLCEQKGQIQLVQAIANVIDKGIDLELTLVGDGEMRPEVEHAIAERNIQENVTITGWATEDEVHHYINNSKALILPSFAEGLPVVIMEAFALGRPVLSTYIAGIPELVKPKLNGWLCAASDIESITESIIELLSHDPSTLANMGNHGRTLVHNNHNINIEAQNLADYFYNYYPKEQK